MTLALTCGMLSWRRVLGGLGSPLSTRVGGQIYFVGQLGKYIPGAVWPVVTQMELGSDHQVPRRRSVAALLIAVLISLVSGFSIGSVIAAVDLGSRHPWWWLALAAVPFGAALLIPQVLWSLLRLVPKTRIGPGVGAQVSGRAMLAAVGWSLAGWALYGLHIALLAALAAPGRFGPALIIGTGAYALAWCAGMIAFLLPAGAGARDGVLVLMLSSSIPTSAAIAVAVVSRVVTTVADLSWAGVAVLATQRARHRSTPARPNASQAG